MSCGPSLSARRTSSESRALASCICHVCTENPLRSDWVCQTSSDGEVQADPPNPSTSTEAVHDRHLAHGLTRSVASNIAAAGHLETFAPPTLVDAANGDPHDGVLHNQAGNPGSRVAGWWSSWSASSWHLCMSSGSFGRYNLRAHPGAGSAPVAGYTGRPSIRTNTSQDGMARATHRRLCALRGRTDAGVYH